MLPKHIKNNKTKIKIICPKHGVFEQRVNDHLRGVGCRWCTINSSNKAYVLGVYDGETPVALKYGITKQPDRRFSDVQKGTCFRLVKLGLWSFDDPVKCTGAELEIKNNVTRLLSFDEFNDAFNVLYERYSNICHFNKTHKNQIINLFRK